MATRQFDIAAAPKSQPAVPQHTPVSESATPELASRGLLPHVALGVGVLPPQARAAALSRSSGGHLARAGDVLLQLQRLHGNRYVQRVLGHTRGDAQQTPRPVTAPVIQTKLVLGPAGDRYEREADHVAETVMRSLSGQDGPAGSEAASAAGRVRRVPDRPAAEDKTSAPVHLRRSGRAVQRAILAIDGATDRPDALQATRNCLFNLTSHKRLPTSTGKVARHYLAGDARGQVYGPDVAATALAGLAAGSSTIGPLETLYFLGHGTTSNIAGLTPVGLATELVNAFAGYLGTFIGALKIVACYSASTMQFGDTGRMGASVATSYAEQLKNQLDTTGDPKFRPRFVEGIRGIAWADEDTGQRVGYDVSGERKNQLNPLEEVYVAPMWVTKWFKAMTDTDPATRKAGMDAILEQMHKNLGLPATTARRVLGKAARERYLSGSARSDFKVAAKKLRSAAENKPPDKALATTALKRMRLDWETMDTAARKATQTKAINAYDAYLMAFQARRPSWQAMAEEWVI